MMLTAEINAAPGHEAQVARDLLSLAVSHHHVQSTSDRGRFMVADYLAELYEQAMAEIIPAVVEAPPAPMDESAVPRRRGRARKEGS